VTARQVVGDGFWCAAELVEVPALLRATNKALLQSEKTMNTSVIDRPVTELLTSLFSCTSLAEEPLDIACQGHFLLGVLHRATVEPVAVTRGVLVVVGGPQYRVGSHRQFLLLARQLAGEGIPVLRFDYRGMGDSPSELRGFQHIDEDIAAALTAFQQHQPQLTEFVLWGLCDGATAALKFAVKDARVSGLVLLNPWVYSEEGEARAYLQHYYWRRLSSPSFWRNLASGKVRIGRSLASLWGLLWRVMKRVLRPACDQLGGSGMSNERLPPVNLVDQWLINLKLFDGRLLLLMSGQDLTAKEFESAVQGDAGLRRLLQRSQVTRVDMEAADHTFSRRVWRDEVAEKTRLWLKSW